MILLWMWIGWAALLLVASDMDRIIIAGLGGLVLVCLTLAKMAWVVVRGHS